MQHVLALVGDLLLLAAVVAVVVAVVSRYRRARIPETWVAPRSPEQTWALLCHLASTVPGQEVSFHSNAVMLTRRRSNTFLMVVLAVISVVGLVLVIWELVSAPETLTLHLYTQPRGSVIVLDGKVPVRGADTLRKGLESFASPMAAAPARMPLASR